MLCRPRKRLPRRTDLCILAYLFPNIAPQSEIRHSGTSFNMEDQNNFPKDWELGYTHSHMSKLVMRLLEINRPFKWKVLWISVCHDGHRKNVGCNNSWPTRGMTSVLRTVTWQPTSTSHLLRSHASAPRC